MIKKILVPGASDERPEKGDQVYGELSKSTDLGIWQVGNISCPTRVPGAPTQVHNTASHQAAAWDLLIHPEWVHLGSHGHMILDGCMVAWLHGCMASRVMVHGVMAVPIQSSLSVLSLNHALFCFSALCGYSTGWNQV